MDASTVWTILWKELRDAWRHRWFVLFTLVFAGLALTLSLLGRSGLGNFGIVGFGRTAASLINLVLLIVPLLGLLMGAVSIAAEREHGTLLTLMAQPVTQQEILCGKFLGASAALGIVVSLGFGASGLVIARASGWAHGIAYLGVAALTLLLGVVHVGLGVCLSVLTRRTNTAIGLALVAWLAVSLFSDLGVMGSAVILRLTPAQLLWLSFVNPVQVFKVAALQLLHGNLELLGPAGFYASSVLGEWLLPLLVGLLLGWIALTAWLSWWGFQRRGVL